MISRLAPGFMPVIVLAIFMWPADSRAALATAAGWQADCAAYIAILSGTGDGDDLDITYCLGQTLGIVAGFETGSRIGALSMASLLTVLLDLDAESVFELFGKTDTEELLGYCITEEPSGSRYITILSDYLNRHPDKSELPVTAVFFEALQETFPCANQTETTVGDADGNADGVAPESDN
ncbi:MAG: Rap1a/Tai family immunity protein [Gammaproteobacteria bacterium]